ncbi:hypothetical protein [Arsukibacterium sp.]|uniref:hypothetical protein n=1 Tax=Arsukibacterium sp. TaxID=1977258 RepID=UPI00299E5491|nr:hypothetical protein [Arsukibacterium sp.]MDX1538359.1 hypothetical protein [Arsukibacterium sp.]
MNNDIQLHNRWLGGEKLEAFEFMHNEYVRVISGQYSGEQGSVVSIVQIEENPFYILETEAGKDIEVKETEIERANS